MIQINIAETLTMFLQIGLVVGLFFLVGVILHTRAKALSIKKELDLNWSFYNTKKRRKCASFFMQ